MKRKLVFAMLLGSVFACSTLANADGNLELTDKILIGETEDNSRNFCARIDNTGDAPIALDDASLAIFGPNDELITTEDYITTYPSRLVLQPGEHTYVHSFIWDSALEGVEVADLKVSLQPEYDGRDTTKLPVESHVEINGSNSYDNYVYFTITNDTDEIKYSVMVNIAMYDANNNLIYTEQEGYSPLGIHPGTSVTLRDYVDKEIVEYYENHGITPASSDVIAYWIDNDY